MKRCWPGGGWPPGPEPNLSLSPHGGEWNGKKHAGMNAGHDADGHAAAATEDASVARRMRPKHAISGSQELEENGGHAFFFYFATPSGEITC